MKEINSGTQIPIKKNISSQTGDRFPQMLIQTFGNFILIGSLINKTRNKNNKENPLCRLFSLGTD